MPAQVAESMRIPAGERLIVALDVPDIDAAKALVRELDRAVVFYKLGLELAAARGYFDLLDWLLARGKRVFADLKYHDVPATVGAAVRQIRACGATFLTVHAERASMQAAAAEKGPDLKLLAVTVLTSLDRADLAEQGFGGEVSELVATRATQAIAAGCDGLIASGREAGRLRGQLGGGPIIVTPGIRPGAGYAADDQKRVVTAGEALRGGADYLVVGRPIRSAADPRAAAEALQAEIASHFE